MDSDKHQHDDPANEAGNLKATCARLGQLDLSGDEKDSFRGQAKEDTNPKVNTPHEVLDQAGFAAPPIPENVTLKSRTQSSDEAGPAPETETDVCVDPDDEASNPLKNIEHSDVPSGIDGMKTIGGDSTAEIASQSGEIQSDAKTETLGHSSPPPEGLPNTCNQSSIESTREAGRDSSGHPLRSTLDSNSSAAHAKGGAAGNQHEHAVHASSASSACTSDHAPTSGPTSGKASTAISSKNRHSCKCSLCKAMLETRVVLRLLAELDRDDPSYLKYFARLEQAFSTVELITKQLLDSHVDSSDEDQEAVIELAGAVKLFRRALDEGDHGEPMRTVMIERRKMHTGGPGSFLVKLGIRIEFIMIKSKHSFASNLDNVSPEDLGLARHITVDSPSALPDEKVCVTTRLVLGYDVPLAVSYPGEAWACDYCILCRRPCFQLRPGSNERHLTPLPPHLRTTEDSSTIYGYWKLP